MNIWLYSIGVAGNKFLGGYFTDITGKNYDYSADDEDRMNWMGCLAGFGDSKTLADKVPQSIVDKVTQVMNIKKEAKK